MAALYSNQVKQAIRILNQSVAVAADECSWPATLDALSTILITLLILGIGGDQTRATIGRIYEEVARLEETLSSATKASPNQLGRA